MAQDKVEISMRGLSRWSKAIEGTGPNVKRAITRISAVFAAFIRKRFVIFSRGGGDWPPLAPSTIARRRRGSSVILRDTGLLFSQLHPKAASIQRAKYSFTASVKFGGTGTYPDGTNVTDVMSFHQTGGGNLPRRRIIVNPDQATKDKMAKILKEGTKGDAK